MSWDKKLAGWWQLCGGGKAQQSLVRLWKLDLVMYIAGMCTCMCARACTRVTAACVYICGCVGGCWWVHSCIHVSVAILLFVNVWVRYYCKIWYGQEDWDLWCSNIYKNIWYIEWDWSTGFSSNIHWVMNFFWFHGLSFVYQVLKRMKYLNGWQISILIV